MKRHPMTRRAGACLWPFLTATLDERTNKPVWDEDFLFFNVSIREQVEQCKSYPDGNPC